MSYITGSTSGLAPSSVSVTFVPGTASQPVAEDVDLRGTLQSISGLAGNYLTNISGFKINPGMLVYLQNGYTNGGVTRAGDTYYCLLYTSDAADE